MAPATYAGSKWLSCASPPPAHCYDGNRRWPYPSGGSAKLLCSCPLPLSLALSVVDVDVTPGRNSSPADRVAGKRGLEMGPLNGEGPGAMDTVDEVAGPRPSILWWMTSSCGAGSRF